MTTTNPTRHQGSSPADLREAMVAGLRDTGMITSEPVAAAFTAVERHLFAPEETLQAAYSPDNTPTVKRDPAGRVTSCMSAASVQAAMLEQAQITPGMKVLEVGSGGYNAALIAELVGPTGQVTSIDIDPDVTTRARRFLDHAGYGHVNVVCADAEYGVAGHAPYDVILATVSTPDIPPAWLAQLAPKGRIVAPVELAAGITRSVAFERDGDTLASVSYGLAHFVPMQGEGADPTSHTLALPVGVILRSDRPLDGVNEVALRAALHAPHIDAWSGTGFQLPDEIDLYLLTAAGMVMLHATPEAISASLVGRGARMGVPALVDGDSIAWNTTRESLDPAIGSRESGVTACGPGAETLAQDYIGHIRYWAAHYAARNTASIHYLPHDSTTPVPHGWRAQRRHGSFVVSWPKAPVA